MVIPCERPFFFSFCFSIGNVFSNTIKSMPHIKCTFFYFIFLNLPDYQEYSSVQFSFLICFILKKNFAIFEQQKQRNDPPSQQCLLIVKGCNGLLFWITLNYASAPNVETIDRRLCILYVCKCTLESLTLHLTHSLPAQFNWFLTCRAVNGSDRGLKIGKLKQQNEMYCNCT